jgi:hypothetical protein
MVKTGMEMNSRTESQGNREKGSNGSTLLERNTRNNGIKSPNRDNPMR